MQVTRTENTLIFQSSEYFTKHRERVKYTFSESERKNDEKILKIKENMISQAVASILQLEQQNDKMIKEMVDSIPHHNELNSDVSYTAHAFDDFSWDLMSKLK
jgi:hypothetical protein